jgi:hypothetical protein
MTPPLRARVRPAGSPETSPCVERAGRRIPPLLQERLKAAREPTPTRAANGKTKRTHVSSRGAAAELALVAGIHDRMPLILRREDFDRWLGIASVRGRTGGLVDEQDANRRPIRGAG